MRRNLGAAAGLAIVVLVAVTAAQGPGMRGGTRVTPGQECPAGTTETRPGSCQAPEFPPPSIVDYRPRTTLVRAEHKVPKAKFPAVDIHGHAPSLATPEAINSLVAAMDALNLRVFVSADNSSGERLTRTLQTINASPHKDRFRILAGVDFRNVGPGWAAQAVKQLEADIKAGAVGVGEVSKAFGLNTRKPDGSRLKVDDPLLDPLWQAFARLDVPVFIHTAEPQEFFQPLDNHNERWLELALFANRRNNQPGQVTFDEPRTPASGGTGSRWRNAYSRSLSLNSRSAMRGRRVRASRNRSHSTRSVPIPSTSPPGRSGGGVRVTRRRANGRRAR